MAGISSSTDYFLKIDGIAGESRRVGHENEIEVMSWAFGCSQTALGDFGGGQGAAGRVSMQDFHFTKMMCKAGPKIVQSMFKGEHIATVKMVARRLGMQGGKPLDYLIWEFADVVISSHSYSGPSSEVPTEAISFRFGKCKVHYRAVKDNGQPEGALSGGWDLRKNQTWA
jgi:type VI secretion system secreted protein Hcp